MHLHELPTHRKQTEGTFSISIQERWKRDQEMATDDSAVDTSAPYQDKLSPTNSLFLDPPLSMVCRLYTECEP